MPELAVVTGGNRGLGLEVVWRLAERGTSVVLTSRDRGLGEAEAKRARDRGLDVRAEILDVNDAKSTARFVERLDDHELNVLVSNAAIALDGFDDDVVARTLATNYRGATSVVDALTPRLVRGSRVVMVSSGVGALASLAPSIRARFDPPRSRAAIDAAVMDFETLVHVGKHAATGWPSSAYAISKVALNAWTRLAAEELALRGVLVNAVCPGWVRTRMGGKGAPRSVKEGGASILWAASLPPDGPTGGMFRDGVRIPW